MTDIGIFPFGEPVRTVEQTDRSPKRVFILGVYASAVHARWIGPDEKTRVLALAVASEPYIFWRGEGADEIVSRIEFPDELGRLTPADFRFNGPSGKTLDELIIEPLGIRRSDTWLCDLVPYSCVNLGQKRALEREYLPLVKTHHLPEPTVNGVPKELSNEHRRETIRTELLDSKAGILILLGDKPIRWFLKYFEHRWKNLADFGEDEESYGRLHSIKIIDRDFSVLPIAHPRQIGKLGIHSRKWEALHREWVQPASRLLDQAEQI